MVEDKTNAASAPNAHEHRDFSKIVIGTKKLGDPTVDLDAFLGTSSAYTDKQKILRAIAAKDIKQLKEISDYYFTANGIYQRFCKYLAFLYRYDYMVSVNIEKKGLKQDKVLKEYYRILDYYDNSNIKRMLGEMALEVIKNGCYYCYNVSTQETVQVQQLPTDYCRSRFNYKGRPAVEMNMKYFDDKFNDPAYRLRVLQIFPKDIQKGSMQYKDGKLPAEYSGDTSGWYLLDTAKAYKFNLDGNDIPVFIDTIVPLIELAEAQALDRKKTMQKLLKILIQKLPLDKNSELVFDIDEARDIHRNAVEMLKNAVGVDILTTFADIDVANISDSNSTTTKDDLEKVERGVFNAAGVANNLFNTEGNTSLDRSILNDESMVRGLIYQFQDFLQDTLTDITKLKGLAFKFKILETTAYNYKDMSKMYKEQTQIGFSKLLPQIALGHSQKEILSNITFENDFLELSKIMIPPMSSNVMSAKALNDSGSSGEAGRPSLPDNEKSDKTLQNIEAKGGQE